MTNGSIQQFQLVLDTQLFEFGSGCGEHTGIFAAVGDIDLIHVFHQIQGGLFADMLVKSSAEVVGDIVFSIGKCTGAAETAHDRAGLTADTGFHFLTVDRTVAFAQRITRLKYSNLQSRFFLNQFIGREDSARTGSNNNYIIHHSCHLCFLKTERIKKARIH